MWHHGDSMMFDVWVCERWMTRDSKNAIKQQHFTKYTIRNHNIQDYSNKQPTTSREKQPKTLAKKKIKKSSYFWVQRNEKVILETCETYRVNADWWQWCNCGSEFVNTSGDGGWSVVQRLDFNVDFSFRFLAIGIWIRIGIETALVSTFLPAGVLPRLNTESILIYFGCGGWSYSHWHLIHWAGWLDGAGIALDRLFFFLTGNTKQNEWVKLNRVFNCLSTLSCEFSYCCRSHNSFASTIIKEKNIFMMKSLLFRYGEFPLI